jgi:hypothetical protein
MEADGERMNWRWVVAAVAASPGFEVTLLDPAKAIKTRAGARLDENAAIENLLLWLDRRTPAPKRRKAAKAPVLAKSRRASKSGASR